MDELIKTFHIDWKLLIAQFINFGIVFVVLYFFALKPLTKIMKERTQKIEEGLKNAQNIEEKMQRIVKKEKEVINKAKKEAQIINEASIKQAEERKAAIIAKAQTEVKTIIKNAKDEVAGMKREMIEEIKNESMDYIIMATEKILKENINVEIDKKIIKNQLAKIK